MAAERGGRESGGRAGAGTGSWRVCEPSSVEATGSGKLTEGLRRTGPGVAGRADRIEVGRGEGGMEGETTLMGSGTFIEGTGDGEARSALGRKAGVALMLAGRTYGEA